MDGIQISVEDGLLHVAAAILVAEGGYLMQLRDPNPRIRLPDHWTCFGGGVEPGETPVEALVRELAEELELRVRDPRWFTRTEWTLPRAEVRRMQLDFFVVPVSAEEIAAMVQHEGADKRVMPIEELLVQPRVAPWDLAAVMMHARQETLFA